MNRFGSLIMVLLWALAQGIGADGPPEDAPPSAALFSDDPSQTSYVGLFAVDDSYELRPCVAHMEDEADDHVRMAMDDMDPPLILVGDASPLRGGEISHWLDERQSMAPGGRVVFAVADEEITIYVVGKMATASFEALKIDYEVHMSDASGDHLLYHEQRSARGEMPELIWVGDLDGDKRPDLIMDFGDDPEPYRLYLSRTAKWLKGDRALLSMKI